MTTYPNLYIDSWDSGQPNAKWDSGLQYDVNVGTPSGDVTPYLALITSEHRDKIKFMTMLANLFQPMADNIHTLGGMYEKFDLEVAVGSQLDVVGQWVGRSRELQVPLTGVYFSFDTAGVGWDEGAWKGPFDPGTQLFLLPDDEYRQLLQITVLNNKWDGTKEQAYTNWAEVFGTDYQLLIQDYGDMHISYAVLGSPPNAVVQALFTGGYLTNKPAGVTVDNYITPSVESAPYFGFDVENDSISGFDVGAWGILNPPA